MYNDKDKVTMAFNLVYSRNPSDDRTGRNRKFLRNFTNASDKDEGLRGSMPKSFASAEFQVC